MQVTQDQMEICKGFIANAIADTISSMTQPLGYEHITDVLPYQGALMTMDDNGNPRVIFTTHDGDEIIITVGGS